MPTYTYRCGACAHEFDQFQRITDAALTDCPLCGGSIKRVLHPVGIVFKGSGWYITDSRKPAAGDNGGGDKVDKSETKKEPAKSAKSESKATAAAEG